MGYKEVCLHCQKAWNQPFTREIEEFVCPECRQPTIRLNQRFRPPKKMDKKKWAVVKYLIQNGFYFQPIKDLSSNEISNFPENLKDAKIFVEKYKSQALKK